MKGRPPLEPRIAALEAEIVAIKALLAKLAEILPQQPPNAYKQQFTVWPNARR